MRYLAALAALALLALAAWVSIGSHSDGQFGPGPVADDSSGLAIRAGGGRGDGGDYRSLSETPDRRLAGHQAGAEEVRIASILRPDAPAEREDRSSARQTAGPDSGGVGHSSRVQDVGPQYDVRCTRFLCVGDSTGSYCPWGRPMASGLQVFPGAAACHPARMGQSFDLPSGITFECLDTGGMVGWSNVDIWCYDAWHWGAPGTAYYEDEGGNPIPCPSCADYIVIEWLARE